MEHFYEPITGWFSFPDLYREMAQKFPSGSRFVEVGVFEGKSLCFLAVEIINAGKEIDLVAVDGFPWDDLLPKFLTNMKPIEGRYRYIKGNSWESAALFEDGSIEFCFIDADHDRDSVSKDVTAYLPKMKPGGVIAGHDYNEHWPGLRQAVDEIFGDRVIVNAIESTWRVNL